MNVQVTIKVDRESIAELVEAFKGDISGSQLTHGQTLPQMPKPVTQPTSATQSQVPQAAQPAQQNAQIYSAQIAQKTQLSQEATTSGVAPVQTAAPVSSPSYTLEDLASAAMPLMERGMMAQLQELLAGYGVEDLPSLPAEHYGNFATALRGMGAQI